MSERSQLIKSIILVHDRYWADDGEGEMLLRIPLPEGFEYDVDDLGQGEVVVQYWRE